MVEIHCIYGDIFNQKADVLVCPSDPSLKHRGGLSKIISDRAGKKFQDYCDNSNLKKPIRDGYWVTSPAFDLESQFKNICAIVSPTFDSARKDKTCNALYNCVYYLLDDYADKFSSIVLPAVGNGLGGYSSFHCADAIVDAIIERAVEMGRSRKHSYSLSKVMICLNDQETYKAFEQKLTRVVKQ